MDSNSTQNVGNDVPVLISSKRYMVLKVKFIVYLREFKIQEENLKMIYVSLSLKI